MDFSALSRSRDYVGSSISEIMRFRCKIDDMGGRDGPKLRRLGFMARRAYEPSSSPLMEEACEIEEDCDRPRSPRPWLGRVKRSIFRPIHCIASTSSKIFRKGIFHALLLVWFLTPKQNEHGISKRESFRILEAMCERPFVKLENAKRPLTTGMVATEKAWDLEMIMVI
ncbi:hypothetical protein Prudu_015201 [Prunus dulcis]|uniref:Uncharacterized protein n=1 Tax=Prunus dulcis TaxID=3755 RepID=A0A4Y1RIG4_PRUDU|nr:hypothetical protein Prudu_015201 [Prunus dulcis]